ncbi:hypothetical protein HHK36_020346 [Tetracentron sinense]|uniref:Uncharacterized protein n=1 Tax=Tetracentron sinense TaxID=13715 RepID=A0A834YV91_TETSI|nr:hypothetical protein HHK36_020346 [Tetracentron sinense]
MSVQFTRAWLYASYPKWPQMQVQNQQPQHGQQNTQGTVHQGHKGGGQPSPQPFVQPEEGNKCQICERFNHMALDYWHRFDNSYQSTSIPQALAVVTLTDLQAKEWYTDYAASTHMTGHPGKDLAKGSRRGGIYVLDEAKVALFSIRNRTTSEEVQGELSTYTDWVETYDAVNDSPLLVVTNAPLAPEHQVTETLFVEPVSSSMPTQVAADSLPIHGVPDSMPCDDADGMSSPQVDDASPFDATCIYNTHGDHATTNELPVPDFDITLHQHEIDNQTSCIDSNQSPSAVAHVHPYNTRSKSGTLKPRVLTSLGCYSFS